ncbi:uncharacterized protein LOC111110892 isoform X3 [Crassostrea virginica]
MLISTYQNFIFKIAFIASIFYFVKVKSTEKCNQNQILDELTNKCIDCPAGFYGPRCNVTCPFPNFGQDCLSICTCIKDQCNYIYGCKIGSGVGKDIFENYIKSVCICDVCTVRSCVG